MTTPLQRSTDDEAAATFSSARRRLFGIAYRMLGSAVEAEDVVQDAWLRWQGAERSEVIDPVAFLATTTTRLAINVAQSARSRRETYIGPWLPEPVDTSADPELGAVRGEALSMAVLLLLEKLSPQERAAYVLREAFDYPYDEIASILQTNEPNVRQLVVRAKRHVDGEPRARAPVPIAEQRRLFDAFIAAARNGDREALEKLFVADVVSLTDSNGLVKATRVPVVGRMRVARFIASFAAGFWKDVTLTELETNGQPALLVSRDGVPSALAMITATTEGIEQLGWVMNPEKLVAFTRVAPG